MVIMAACTLSIFNSSLYIYIFFFTLPKKSAKVVCKRPDMFAENHGKRRATTFDVTMGSYDGTETSELVGSLLLSQLQNLDVNIGLYRDDG